MTIEERINWLADYYINETNLPVSKISYWITYILLKILLTHLEEDPLEAKELDDLISKVSLTKYQADKNNEAKTKMFQILSNLPDEIFLNYDKQYHFKDTEIWTYLSNKHYLVILSKVDDVFKFKNCCRILK